jgi:hypothetical protein
MADRPPPSATAIIIGTAILSLVTGYMIGTATSLNLLPSPFSSAPAKTRSRSDTTGYDDEEESSEEEIEAGEVLDHAPNWANGPEADKRDGLTVAAPAPTKKREVVDDNEECKLVLVVRTDLGMTKGMFHFSPLRTSAVGRPCLPRILVVAVALTLPRQNRSPMRPRRARMLQVVPTHEPLPARLGARWPGQNRGADQQRGGDRGAGC